MSDLHLFTSRTRAEEHTDRILDAARGSGTLVLAGDIFDFRWSQWPSVETTAAEAARWVEGLLAASPETDVHYVLGNHDHSPVLIERLQLISALRPRFRWHPFQLRLGNAVFLHGDAANPGMQPEGLSAYRAGFAHAEPASAVAQWAYDAAMALGLHRVGARLAFRNVTVARRLTRYLDALGPEWSEGVRNVYFGHTHRALDGFEHRGRRFFNCGSPMLGLRFQIVEADLS